MTRTDKRMRLSAFLLVANLVLIWGNSLLPGPISGAISDAVKAFLKAALSLLLPGGIVESAHSGVLVRKLGHFLEFTSLGCILTWRFGMQGRKPYLAFLAGATVAALDEGLQLFIPGRAGRLTDVCIDSGGVLFGMLLLTLGNSYCTARNQRKKEN